LRIRPSRIQQFRPVLLKSRNALQQPLIAMRQSSSVTFALRDHMGAIEQERRAVGGVLRPISYQRSVSPFGLVAR
jgi:hypothetical protein